ncbi:NAD-dependent protein deacetylase [Patulibacter minatonensis]|uniref:NAD-dependent protein deacetylase n=1 Tax=Patulibacter minatonensis TaxID=298163 RepID=UPI00047E342F|nr:NAD-dependent protein deacetylase [Patulibacter minatonensis]
MSPVDADTDTALDALARMIDAAPGTLVLSGAGLSTESGIPDYRGPDGERRVSPMQYRDFVGSSDARRRYWARAFVGWRNFSAAAPNAGHLAVARLQQAGHLGAIVTQNVDELHQAAGAQDVIDLHGTLSRVVCLTCGDRISRWDLDERMAAENPSFAVHTGEIRPDGDVTLEEVQVADFRVPICERCGADTLKPDVVFFGESVPKDRVERSFALTDEAPALLVLGSSLVVFSGYRFVRRAAANGTPVAIVTLGPTRGDDAATVVLKTPLGTTLQALAERLGV